MTRPNWSERGWRQIDRDELPCNRGSWSANQPQSRLRASRHTVVVGHAEIDGKEVRDIPDETLSLPVQITRAVFYTESNAAPSVANSQQP